MFKFLSKPEADIEINSEKRVLPGTQLPVEIRVTPREEITPRALRAELVGEETFYVRQTSRDSKGNTTTRIMKKTGTIASINATLAEQPVLHTGVAQRWNTSMQIPDEAPPTCRGKLVNIQWKIKAVLDVPKRPDRSQEVPLIVLNASPQDSPGPVYGYEELKNFSVNLDVCPTASPGDILIGRLTLQIKDRMNVQGIRLELVQIEDAGARSSTEVVTRNEVAGATSFDQYESPSFEFSLHIPPEAPQTAVSAHSSLRWKLKAVIARRLMTDFNIEREILVLGKPENKGN